MITTHLTPGRIRPLGIIAALGCTALTLACASSGNRTIAPVAETVVCQEPVLRLEETESEAMQRIGDVAILVSTRMPQCEEVVRISHETRSPSFGERLAAGPGNTGSEGYLTRREETDLALARRNDDGQIVLDENFDLIALSRNVCVMRKTWTVSWESDAKGGISASSEEARNRRRLVFGLASHLGYPKKIQYPPK